MRRLAPFAAALVALAAVAASGCRYGVAAPPRLGEDVRVVVIANDARLVRAQAALQAAVARALEERLGWRVSPTGTARLELAMAEERIDATGTDRGDVPARWSISLHGHALLRSRHGTELGDFVGTGYASGLADETEAIDNAAREAAIQLTSWLETAGRRWGTGDPAAARPAP
ncbi:MAG TPA: hypothetical protein VEL07_22590 [Planctomycetota bacterium]|nr:hypothetical protein [Planctomycetota bacterium]